MLNAIFEFFMSIFRRFFSQAKPKLTQSGAALKSILLSVDQTTGIATLTLNRPRKKNAFTEGMYREVGHTLRQLSQDSTVTACVITGAGDFFSSGNDLSNFSKVMHPLKMAKTARDILEAYVDSYIRCSKPLVAVVNGPALGIAATTLGLCDRVYAHERAYFKTPFAALGQAPEGCSSYLFPRIMGDEMANEVLWKGRQLTAAQAKTAGLVSDISNDGDALMAAAVAYCRSLDTNSGRPVIKGPLVDKLLEVNKTECDILERKWISPECFNALSTFLESKNQRMAALMLR